MRRLLSAVLVLMLLLASVAEASNGIDRKRFPETLKGQHFQVFYARTGPEAVEKTYAERTLKAAEAAYEKLVTKGGFRPPRMLPIPIVLESAEKSLGGKASCAQRGFEMVVQINPHMDPVFSLEDVVSHEFVHVLQLAYDKGMTSPTWAIEGTAPVGSFYALGSDAAKLGDWSHLNMYWVTHSTPMKEMDYDPSLFWYVTAERYGGLTYLRRLFEWSEDVDWERAAQLSAIQGGAPPTTTFDSLWRSYVLDLFSGRLPSQYITEMWFYPTRLTWDGKPTNVTHGDQRSGAGPLGQPYSYFEPLQLGPYSFDVLAVQNTTSAPMALTVSADAKVVEAYVVKPGTAMAAALQNADGPKKGNRKPVPSGEGTVGAKLDLNTPFQFASVPGGRTLVVLMRLGAWGSGTYSLKLQPAEPKTPVLRMTPLQEIPPGPDSAGSPPKLTEDELAALKSGTWAAGASPLEATLKDASQYRTILIDIAGKTVTVNGDSFPLKAAATTGGGATPDPMVPLREIAGHLGWKVDGNRISNGTQWVQLYPGSKSASSSLGMMEMRNAPVAAGDDLLVDTFVFTMLGCGVSYSSDWIQLIFPKP